MTKRNDYGAIVVDELNRLGVTLRTNVAKLGDRTVTIPDKTLSTFLRNIQSPERHRFRCWLWLGNRTTRNDARFNMKTAATGGIGFRAGRLAYQLLRGPLAADEVLRRRCGSRMCVNPDHVVPWPVATIERES